MDGTESDEENSMRPGRKLHSAAASLLLLAVLHNTAAAWQAAKPNADELRIDRFVQKYCVDCHGETEPTRGLDLESQRFSVADWKADGVRKQWEHIF